MEPDPAAVLHKILDPRDNTTGGGAASALAGAMAAALTAMVGRLSRGREGMEPPAFYDQISSLAEVLAQRLADGSQEDSRAFEQVRAAFALPKGTEAEKQARSEAIQAAWRYATHVPLGNAELCQAVLDLAQRLEGRSNPNAASDVACAMHLARAGLLGCVENVRINLPAIKYPSDAADLAERLRRLESRISQP